MRGQVATISFFNYKGKQKWWAFRQMQTAPHKLSKLQDLQFFKMLGSGGGNGFSILPDFSVYAVLCVWESYESAKDHLNESQPFCVMQSRATHYIHVYMKATRCKGSWSGKKPFDEFVTYQQEEPIAVLTRASIATKKLLSFWKNVPKVSEKLHTYNKGLIFSKGIGELPVVQQATFSIWQSRKKMVEYAYQGKRHQEMIRKTRELQWYTEEMFVEFALFKIDHQWPEHDLSQIQLKEYSQSPSFE